METIQFYPLDIKYKVVGSKAHIYLFGKTTDNKQICIIDENFRPYFYVLLKDDNDAEVFREKVLKLKVEEKERISEIADAKIVEKNYLGNMRKAIKIYANIPHDVPVIRKVIKDWIVVESTKEYDIPFVRRYFLDTGITPLTLTEAEGESADMHCKVPVFRIENIKQAGTDSIKNPKILAFDIETYNPEGSRVLAEEHPIVMLGFYGEDFKKVITWKRFKTKKDYIEFVDGEVDLILKFKEIIEHYKPDIITGYFSDGFDFPYIVSRAEKYSIKLDIGLDYSVVKAKRGKTSIMQISGIVHLDVFRFINKILGRALETDSYNLSAVSSELLNEEKDDVDVGKLAEIWDKNSEELEKYCKYNLKDAMLTYNLCVKIFPNIEELVKIIGLPIFDVNRMGYSQLVEWYIMKQVQDFNEIAPNKPNYYEIGERREFTYKGGFVFEPKAGLYKDIAVFDFRSLYPTIITSHNIGLSTLNCKCCRDDASYAPTDEKKYWFCKKTKGFIAQIVEGLITRRMRIKELLKEKKDIILEARSESLKLLGNSFYGYLGFFGARWYSIECAKSVTAYGRYYINMVIDEAKKQGFNVIYSDTDSIFLTFEGKRRDDAREFAEKINSDLPGLMELEFEDFYPSGIFVSAKMGTFGAKKKYALLKQDGFLKITGFETVRRNWSPIAKEVQKNVLNIILKENDVKKAISYVRNVVKLLRDKEIENKDVIINVQLQKDIASYAAISPHVAVARKLKAQGRNVGKGSIISFIVTSGSGIIRDRAKIVEEIEEGGYDADYYVNHQIIPSVERIFNVLGHNKEELTEEQSQSKLEGFFG
ncbi:DNA-directed DNA polymerase [Candidatus Woesearchaeota archaeon]|nr:DNA-directed DNA polymerase [Candidatus Woesearchaeota archaeon]